MPLKGEDLRNHLDSLLDGKRFTDQFLSKAIPEGRASREQIGYFGILFYQHTTFTPRVLGTFLSRSEDPVITSRIIDVIIDEETDFRCGEPHGKLALDFVTRFTGISGEEITGMKKHPVATALGEFRLKCARELPIQVAQAVPGIAGESSTSAAFRVISEGLREKYGVKDVDQMSFIVHIEGDEEHSSAGFRTAEEYCTTDELQRTLFEAVDKYSHAWANLWIESEKGLIDLLRS